MDSDEEVDRLFALLQPRVSLHPLHVWDPDDRSTWKYFMDKDDRRVVDKLFPHILPWEDETLKTLGEKMYYFSVFELYSITITTLLGHPNFDTILIQAESTAYGYLVIYKRPPHSGNGGDPIPVNQSFPLRGPHRAINGLYHVIISLCNLFTGGWHLDYYPQPDEYDVPLSREVKDRGTDSVAEIKFEIIQEAAQATLLIQFIPPPPPPQQQQEGQGEEERSIRILGGTIFATHGKKPYTKRIVKQFDEMPPVVVVPKNNIDVDRYVFGVPKGSSLQVTASDLLCEEEQGSRFWTKGALTFPVPTHTASDVQFFTTNDDSKKSLLRLTVFWSDAV